MNSKIIKISMVLIFMLFFTGFFNSVSAVEFNVDNFNIEYTFGYAYNDIKTLYIGTYYIDYDKLTFSNSINHSTYGGFVANDIDSYSKIYGINFNDNILYCAVLGLDDNKLPYTYLCKGVQNTFYCGPSGASYYIYKYDFDSSTWSFVNYTTFIEGCFNYFIGFDNEVKMYNSSDISSAEVLFDSANFVEYKKLSNEELINNCDFKVNFRFNPSSKDYPEGFDKHMYIYENCVVTHSMSNWSNYIVNMSVTLNKEKTYNGDDTYFEYYNSAGEKIIDKTKLYYNKVEKNVVNEGDFYGLLADNIADVIKVTYDICNNSGDLLLKKEYLVKFSKSGVFGETDATGTVLKEITFDSSGNVIENTNKSFETDGFDQTDINKGYSGNTSDITGLTSSATETIKLAKECFSILPGFVWAMVGVFLSTCIALRILGR